MRAVRLGVSGALLLDNHEGMTTLLLIHGGLWEEGMDAARFWRQPGIVAALEHRRFGILAPDGELGQLEMPAGVLPSAFANPFQQRITVDALLGLLPGASELPACPEPPRPEFPPYLETFADAVAGFAAAV